VQSSDMMKEVALQSSSLLG